MHPPTHHTYAPTIAPYVIATSGASLRSDFACAAHVERQAAPAVHAGMPSGLTSLRSDGQQLDTERAAGSSSWVTVTTAGDVIQLKTLSAQQHQLLAALQHVMAKHAEVAPLSGCDLGQYRAARDSPGAEKLQQAPGTA